MKRKVTRETVESAIKLIEERGDKVTIERIRAITGGSPKTIGNIKNVIEGNTINNGMLPLFDSKPTGLSYHNIEEQLDTMIMKRVNTIVMKRVTTVLARLEGTEETKEGPQPNPSSDGAEVPMVALGEMRELWLDAVDLFSVAEQKLDTAQERIAELENEDSDHTETGRRVFKDELARAVHHLIMMVGKSQTEVASLLKLSNSEVSKLKIKGTKLHQKKK
jgi:predicted XRE-type DNA-binding protein